MKKLLSLLLTLALLLPNAAMAASWDDFTDAGTHWAAADLQRAVSDGLLTGTDDHSLSPDAPITTAQMLAILNRVLGASQTADVSALAVPADAWYAQDVAKAAYLGLIPDGVTDYDAPLARQDALAMLAKAFCLTPANQSSAPLSVFSDADTLRAENVSAVANLVSRGLVKGFDGALNVNGRVTRAEFVTLLYRIAGSVKDASALAAGEQAAVVRGDAVIKDVNLGRLCVDCSAGSVSLENAQIDELTLRCSALSSFKMDSASKIGTLTLALGGGSFTYPESGAIGTLRLVSGPLTSITAAQADAVEITGSRLSVSVSGKHSVLSVSGSGNTVSLEKDAELSALTVCGSGNSVYEAGGGENSSVSVGGISVWGSKNSVSACTTGGSAAALYLAGTGCSMTVTLAKGASALTVDGIDSRLAMENNSSIENGALGTLALRGSRTSARIWTDAPTGDVTVASSEGWLTLNTGGAGSISVPGSYNTIAKGRAGEIDKLSITGAGNLYNEYVGNNTKDLSVTGTGNTLELNGSAGTVTVDGANTTLKGAGTVTKLTLNALGCTSSVKAVTTDDSGAKKAQAAKEAAEAAAKKAAEEAAAAALAKQQDEARVLSLVTTGYHGNYTLAWAQSHDYTPVEKKTWVQAKGYSSSTGWLIWVSLTMQRVNIFRGTKGNWDLIYSCIVGTGAPGSGTPVGVYSTTYKSSYGWHESSYTVRPVTGFKSGTGYAFHSRLYYPNGTTLKDASIGYPISHGCVRMYDDDCWYIYNNVPIGTTVVIY